ncbi:fimbrial biogenesis outer membrane usher protein [Pseudomonas sp. NFXW11]|uniref:fimbria/pilus outer membrane usher protein n=1 Tax=Pseudomonas sp. NFXW11 TaxID=2819531 RepID=UPI003CF2EC73
MSSLRFSALGRLPLRWGKGQALTVEQVFGGATLLLSGLLGGTVEAEELIRFNPAFFGNGQGEPVDLSRFSRDNPLVPGVYRLDLYLNQNWVGRQDVRLRAGADSLKVQPCLSSEVLEQLGLDFTRMPPEQAAQARSQSCLGADDLPAHSRFEVDMSELRADLSISQLYLNRSKRGYVPSTDWDSGVNAGFLGYSSNFSDNSADAQRSRQFYSSLNGGINLGDWRLRHNGSYSYEQRSGIGGGSRYSALSSYVQRDVTALEAQLTLGQYYTPGHFFDSVPYTGLQLSSDERMLPDSMRGFAPVVRGVADTTAKVSVRQGPNLLYETTVPPGPFAIDDLYQSGYAGDLNVTITEADGRTRSFVVPFASVAQLLRPGSSRFSLNAGRYRDSRLDKPPVFFQGSYQYGLSDLVTGYGGAILAEEYRAWLGGAALNTELGAVAADFTQSQARGLEQRFPDAPVDTQGHSLRLTYNKLLESTATNFSVAAYRFSSEGYLSFGELARQRDRQMPGGLYKERSRLQLSLSQPLGERLGQLAFSGMAQDYWRRDQGRDITYQVGYANGFRWGSFDFSASRTRSGSGRPDNQYLLSFSVPLGGTRHSPYLSSSIRYDGSRNHGINNSLSGNAGEQGQIGYSLYGAQDSTEGRRNTNYGGNLQYDTSHASYNLGASRGDSYRQVNLGMQGTLVLHPGGLNATSDQGETIAVLEARGAEGAQVLSSNRARIAGNGYGVVAGLTPYRRNEVALDPKGTSRDVELEMTSQQVAPRAGAVVMLHYPTVVGRPLLLQLKRDDGVPIPLGAQVYDAAGSSLTQVGQSGRVFLRGLEGQGQLLIKWGASADEQCLASYSASAHAPPEDGYYQLLELACRLPQSPGRT